MKTLVFFAIFVILQGCKFNFELNLGPYEDKELTLFSLDRSLKIDSNMSLEGTWLVLEEFETVVDVDVNKPPTVVKSAVNNTIKSLSVLTITEDSLDPKIIHITACNPNESSQDYYLNQDLALSNDRSLEWIKPGDHQHTIDFNSFTTFSYTYAHSEDSQEDRSLVKGIKISHNINDLSILPGILSHVNFTVVEANHNSSMAMQAADNYQPVCFDIKEQVYDYYYSSGEGADQTINDHFIKAQVIGFKAKSDAGALVYIHAQRDESERYTLNPSDMPSEIDLTESVEHLTAAYYDSTAVRLYDEYYKNFDAKYSNGDPHPDNKTEFQLTYFGFEPDGIGFSADSERVGDEIDIRYVMKLN